MEMLAESSLPLPLVETSGNSLQAAESSSPLTSKSSEFLIWAKKAWRERPISYWIDLGISSGFMLIAFPASSLLSRVYYNNGGKSKWILSWSAVAGWPLPALLLIPIYILGGVSPSPLTPTLLLSYIVLGLFSAADNFMFAWAYAYLPASTASLLSASSLAFSALFGHLIVKNRITLLSLNAIVVITASAAIIALDSSSDRYPGVSGSQYAIGFVMDVMGSALHGLIFALSELVFVRMLGRRSFHVVLEQQAAVSFCAFAFSTAGVALSGNFREMGAEAEGFRTGMASYCLVLIWSAITFQLGVLGGTAVLYLASTLLAGVLNAVRVPITSVAAVVFLSDPMSGFKILSLVITVWGFMSYIAGTLVFEGVRR